MNRQKLEKKVRKFCNPFYLTCDELRQVYSENYKEINPDNRVIFMKAKRKEIRKSERQKEEKEKISEQHSKSEQELINKWFIRYWKYKWEQRRFKKDFINYYTQCWSA